MAGQSNIEKVGRFDYVEPMNMYLDKSDNAVVYDPEDYNISVNLEVEIPSRIYAENNEVKLVASSDNGSISFFGGTNIINSKDSGSTERGYLTTSWTDISVNNIDGGNKECLGIESINIAYSPNFFPIVTIRFVDVRGASLFAAQQKSYEQWVQKNNFDPKNSFDGASFFKALFSMPSPIFKLTVKGFYGKPVTYKLVMSKFSSDFDSESGNFIANVEFAGYMYGIYTELPMSFIALAPYLDGLKYWKKRNFTFKNGVQIPTIPKLLEDIGTAIKKAPQEALESKAGREFNELNDKINLLKSVRDSFPVKNWIKSEGELSNESKRGIGFAYDNAEIIQSNAYNPYSNNNNEYPIPIQTGTSKTSPLVDRTQVNALNNVGTDDVQRQVYYQVVSLNKSDYVSNTAVSNPMAIIDNFIISKEQIIENYRKLLEKLVEEYGSQYQKYLNDFESLLAESWYNNTAYISGEPTHLFLPVMCMWTNSSNGLGTTEQQVRGVDFLNSGDKTLFVTYLGFKINDNGKVRDCNVDDVKKIVEKCGGSTSFISGEHVKVVFRIRTKILDWADEELKQLEKELDEKKKALYEEQIALSQSLIGYPLTIENVYNIIFAHIDTFMERYYGHLKNLSNDANRTKLLIDRFDTIADVPTKYKEDGTIPPFPCFIEKNDDSEKLVWPPTVLNGSDFEETEFVYEIVNAALQVGNQIQDAIDNIKKAGEGKDGNGNNRDSVYSGIPSTTDTMLPSTPFDMIFSETNPYQKIYDDYKANPQTDILQKIWFVFMCRCAYFAMFYRKYRTINKTSDSENLVNGAQQYFAMCEACNINKLFGENISMSLVKNLDKVDAENNFMKFVNDFITGEAGSSTYKGNKEISAQNFGWKGVDFQTPFKYENYTIFPTKKFDKQEIEKDVENKKWLEDSEKYVVFLNNGHVIEEQVSGHTLNENSIRILNNVTYFQKYRDLIKSDKIITEKGFLHNEENLELFLNDFFGTTGKTMTGGYIGCDLIDRFNVPDAYGQINFKFNNGSKQANEIVKEGLTNSTESISLEKALHSKSIKFTSYVENMECIDPVNVIVNGCLSGDSAKHFITESNVSFKNYLNETADVFTKAYLFLFSIPLTRCYLKATNLCNMQKVFKVALLKEGAFYYWQENYTNIKKQFNGNYGAQMGRDNVPIVANDKTCYSPNPTLWMTEDKTKKYMVWASYSNNIASYGNKTEYYLDYNLGTNPIFSQNIKVADNRKRFLIDYFKKWAQSEDFATISTIEGSSDGLTLSKMKSVMDLYFNEIMYFDYSDVLSENIYINNFNNISEENKNFFKDTYVKFKDYIERLYPDEYVPPVPSSAAKSALSDVANGIKSSDDLKLSVYLTLQSLYTKFIANSNRKRWQFDGEESDFNNFYYIDSYYHKIGDKLIVNGTKLEDMLSDVSDTVLALTNSTDEMYKGSVYEFFAKLCQDNGVNLLALPVQPFTIEKEDEKIVWKLFDTIPYNRMNLSKETSCFISMYTYRPSEHLNLQDNNGLMGYTNDGFDINLNGEKDLPKSLQDFGNTDAPRIPAFAVTYAKQNQSIFKKINVSTSNPQITDASIAMTLNIASKSDSNPRDSVFFGQDMYSVYSNYSYTCDVEMMGCAPIMPLMYFQLNNIPMFRGAYMIINVEHNVVAGNMTTRFKGVRVSKNSIPFVKATYIYTDDLGEPHYGNDEINIEQYSGYTMVNEEELFEDYDDSSLENRMEQAFKLTFNCPGGETKGMCSRYTYRMAYAYINQKTPCDQIAGGDAKDVSFHNRLEKNLGYKKTCDSTFVTVEECKAFIEKEKFYRGDVVVYWAEQGPKDDSCVKYGHAQIYTGDLHSGTISGGSSRWASSTKNNYGSTMVYGSRTNCKYWRLKIFRQPLRPE